MLGGEFAQLFGAEALVVGGEFVHEALFCVFTALWWALGHLPLDVERVFFEGEHTGLGGGDFLPYAFVKREAGLAVFVKADVALFGHPGDGFFGVAGIVYQQHFEASAANAVFKKHHDIVA